MIYVMSDIHGQGTQFHEILNQIGLSSEDKLFILGDVIDRHPDGIDLLQEIRKMHNTTLLMGNHEYMMLQALSNEKDEFLWMLWFANGGSSTYDAYMKLDRQEQESLVHFLDNLPLNAEIRVRDTDFLLVHGLPIELCKPTKKNSDIRSLATWSRIEPYDRMPEGKTVVFGHTPTENYSDVEPMSIWKGERVIGIDCGCAYEKRGRLGCLRLDDMKEFYSSLEGNKVQDTQVAKERP